jgi:hypothetical protein
MRCASITWWRISRAQAWLSALTEANMVATHKHAAGDLLREGPARVEGNREEHNDQPGEKQHGDQRVQRAPLDAQILGEMGPEGAGHGWRPSGATNFVRSAVWASAALR